MRGWGWLFCCRKPSSLLLSREGREAGQGGTRGSHCPHSDADLFRDTAPLPAPPTVAKLSADEQRRSAEELLCVLSVLDGILSQVRVHACLSASNVCGMYSGVWAREHFTWLPEWE